MLSEMAFFLVAAYFAAVFATVAGFGSSTLLVPVALFFMDIKTAVFVVACFHLFNNLFKVRLFFHNIDYKLFVSFGISSIIFAFLGARCISVIPVDVLKSVLGIFLIGFSLYSILNKSFVIKNTSVVNLLGGSISGFQNECTVLIDVLI